VTGDVASSGRPDSHGNDDAEQQEAGPTQIHLHALE